MGSGTPWTYRQEQLLLDLRDNQFIAWKFVAKRLGKTPSQCQAKYTNLKKQERELKENGPKPL